MATYLLFLQISNLEQRCFEQVQELQLQSFHKQNVESNLQSKEKEIEDKNKQIRSLEQVRLISEINL